MELDQCSVQDRKPGGLVNSKSIWICVRDSICACVYITLSVIYLSMLLLYNLQTKQATIFFYRHKKSYSTSNLLNIRTFLVLNSFMLRPSHTSIVHVAHRQNQYSEDGQRRCMYGSSIGQACASLAIQYVKVRVCGARIPLLTSVSRSADSRLLLRIYDDRLSTSRLDTNLCEYRTHVFAVRYVYEWFYAVKRWRDDENTQVQRKNNERLQFIAARNSHKLLQLAAIGSCFWIYVYNILWVFGWTRTLHSVCMCVWLEWNSWVSNYLDYCQFT